MRAERNSGSKDGDLIQHYIKEGKIVPVEITISLLERVINNVFSISIIISLYFVISLLKSFFFTSGNERESKEQIPNRRISSQQGQFGWLEQNDDWKS